MPTDPFPYAIDLARPCDAQPLPRPFSCPHAPEGMVGLRLAIPAKGHLFRALTALAGRQDIRCILIEPAAAPHAIAPNETDLRQWLLAAERFRRTLGRWSPAAPHPCGTQCLCATSPNAICQDECTTIETLRNRTNALAERIRACFHTLTTQECEILHAWAHRAEPGNDKRPITQGALAIAFRCTEKTIYRALRKARNLCPKEYARIQTLRRATRLRESNRFNPNLTS